MATLLGLLPPALAAQDAGSAPALQWAVAPGLFPPGARMALVSGNPFEPGRLTALLSMPDGYRIPPHLHEADERVEVIEGAFLVGTGNRLDAARTRALMPGDTATAPAGVPHYAIARGRTTVSITTEGPFIMSYVNQTEEPWRPFPFGY